MGLLTTPAPVQSTLPLPYALIEPDAPREVFLEGGERRLILHALTQLRISNLKAVLAHEITEDEEHDRQMALGRVARKLGAA